MSLQGSLRDSDSHAERALSDFLDRNFYARMKRYKKWNYQRIVDRRQQLNGIDVHVDIQGGGSLNIDEKASLHYINKDIPTFAFEVSSIQHKGGSTIPGWFVNDQLATNVYCLLWVYASVSQSNRGGDWGTDLARLMVSDFTEVECLMVTKKGVVSFLDARGLTRERLCRRGDEIRNRNIIGRSSAFLNADGTYRSTVSSRDPFYFYYSTKLAEKPVNIVIRKQCLYDIAKHVYRIKPKVMEELFF